MKLVFTDQYAEILLLVNGLAVILFYTARKKRKQRALKFGNFETLEKVAGKGFLKSSDLVLLLRLLALTALIVGISNPALVRQAPSSSSDYVLAIDSSASMQATDIKPSRFEAARSVARSFVDQLAEQSQVGVVEYAGEVENVQELTPDRQAVLDTIDGMEMGDTGGTATGDALSAAGSTLLPSNRSRSIVLVTDGRNNRGSSVNESVEFLVKQNITVHAVGLGSQQEDSTAERSNGTVASFPNLNEQRLEMVANRTGGSFRTVSNASSLRSAFVEIESSEEERDLTMQFIFLAAVLLLLEMVLGSTRFATLP